MFVNNNVEQGTQIKLKHGAQTVPLTEIKRKKKELTSNTRRDAKVLIVSSCLLSSLLLWKFILCMNGLATAIQILRGTIQPVEHSRES